MNPTTGNTAPVNFTGRGKNDAFARIKNNGRRMINNAKAGALDTKALRRLFTATLALKHSPQSSGRNTFPALKELAQELITHSQQSRPQVQASLMNALFEMDQPRQGGDQSFAGKLLTPAQRAQCKNQPASATEPRSANADVPAAATKKQKASMHDTTGGSGGGGSKGETAEGASAARIRNAPTAANPKRYTGLLQQLKQNSAFQEILESCKTPLQIPLKKGKLDKKELIMAIVLPFYKTQSCLREAEASESSKIIAYKLVANKLLQNIDNQAPTIKKALLAVLNRMNKLPSSNLNLFIFSKGQKTIKASSDSSGLLFSGKSAEDKRDEINHKQLMKRSEKIIRELSTITTVDLDEATADLDEATAALKTTYGTITRGGSYSGGGGGGAALHSKNRKLTDLSDKEFLNLSEKELEALLDKL